MAEVTLRAIRSRISVGKKFAVLLLMVLLVVSYIPAAATYAGASGGNSGSTGSTKPSSGGAGSSAAPSSIASPTTTASMSHGDVTSTSAAKVQTESLSYPLERIPSDVGAFTNGSIVQTSDSSAARTDAPAPSQLYWQANWGGTKNDFVTASAVGPDGSVYLVGNTSSFGAGGVDVFIVKYSSSGVLQWQETWGGPKDEGAHGVAVDPTGKFIYVTGSTNENLAGLAATSMFLLKINAIDGSFTGGWQQIVTDGDLTGLIGNAVVVSPTRNEVYVAGTGEIISTPALLGFPAEVTSSDAVVLGFNTGTGAQLWESAWTGDSSPGCLLKENGWPTAGLSIAVSRSGNSVYLGGWTYQGCALPNINQAIVGLLLGFTLITAPQGLDLLNLVWANYVTPCTVTIPGSAACTTLIDSISLSPDGTRLYLTGSQFWNVDIGTFAGGLGDLTAGVPTSLVDAIPWDDVAYDYLQVLTPKLAVTSFVASFSSTGQPTASDWVLKDLSASLGNWNLEAFPMKVQATSTGVYEEGMTNYLSGFQVSGPIFDTYIFEYSSTGKVLTQDFWMTHASVSAVATISVDPSSSDGTPFFVAASSDSPGPFPMRSGQTSPSPGGFTFSANPTGSYSNAAGSNTQQFRGYPLDNMIQGNTHGGFDVSGIVLGPPASVTF